MAAPKARDMTMQAILARTRRAGLAAWRPVYRGFVVFLAFLAALDLLIGATIEPLVSADPGQNGATPAGRRALYHTAPPADVLLIGSSRVYTGLDPAQLSAAVAPALGRAPTILNMGIVWSTPQVDYWLLKNVITADKQPAVIVYGVSEYAFNANNSLSPYYDAEQLATLDDYRQAFPDPTQDVDKQLSFALSQVWQLYRQREVLHDTLQDLWGGQAAPAEIQDATGFLSVDHVMTARDVANSRTDFVGPKGLYNNFTVGGDQLERFAQFLQLAQARGIAVVVLNMPITAEQEALIPPAAYAAYRAFLQQTCAQYGVPYFDYDDHTLFKEPDDFLDPHHLNRVGASTLSPLVARDALLPALQHLGWK